MAQFSYLLCKDGFYVLSEHSHRNVMVVEDHVLLLLLRGPDFALANSFEVQSSIGKNIMPTRAFLQAINCSLYPNADRADKTPAI